MTLPPQQEHLSKDQQIELARKNMQALKIALPLAAVILVLLGVFLPQFQDFGDQAVLFRVMTFGVAIMDILVLRLVLLPAMKKAFRQRFGSDVDHMPDFQ